MNKKVLLFGCGYLGFPLAKELKRQGYFVQVATHSPEKMKVFLGSRIKSVFNNS